MNTSPTDTASRRGFLKQLFAAATTTGVGGVLAAPARAGDGAADTLTALPVGDVRIADHVVGPVVFQADDYDYLLFDAHRTDRRGRSVGTGTGVVRLTQCIDWRIRVDGDQELRGKVFDPSRLDAAGTYEVSNSSWVLDLVEDDPDLAKGPALHHCVFTFQDAAFECVLARYDVTVHDGAFDDLVAYLGEMP